MNTTSEQMGFTLSQCDAPVCAPRRIETISVVEDKEDRQVTFLHIALYFVNLHVCLPVCVLPVHTKLGAIWGIASPHVPAPLTLRRSDCKVAIENQY